VRRVQKNALQIPLAVGKMNQVDARIGEADRRKLYTTAPQGADAQRSANGVGADNRLGAERGVFVHNQIFQREAGERQKVQRTRRRMTKAASAR
jgi:hypothetical protein